VRQHYPGQNRGIPRRFGRKRTRLFNPQHVVEATLKGMPLRLIAVTNRQPLLGLLVRKGINSVSELRGKKLSISSFGGAIYGAAVYLLKNHGLKRKEDVTILAGGSNSARAAALRQGAVDAALLRSPENIRAAGRGFCIFLYVGGEYRGALG